MKTLFSVDRVKLLVKNLQVLSEKVFSTDKTLALELQAMKYEKFEPLGVVFVLSIIKPVYCVLENCFYGETDQAVWQSTWRLRVLWLNHIFEVLPQLP